MTYRLIVKGSLEEAHAALEAHGFHGWEDVGRVESGPVVRLVSDYDLEVKLRRWYDEQPRTAPRFPAGTLLVYSAPWEATYTRPL